MVLERNCELPVDDGSLSSLQLEVFVNAKSTGIHIVPPFWFDISDYVKEGKSFIAHIC